MLDPGHTRAAKRREGAERRRRQKRERMQRWRALQNSDTSMVWVAVSYEVIAALIAWNQVSPEQSEDRKAVGAAITELLKDAAKHGQKP